MNRYEEYKDSGVQWIGEIPSHWKCARLKRICSMKSGDNITAFDIDQSGTYPVYGANGLRGYYAKYNKEGKFLIVGRQGALAGNVHKAEGKFWATDHAIVSEIAVSQNIDFVYYALTAMNLNQYAFETAAQPGLSVSKILSLPILLPPLPEQQAIVTYLDEKVGKIDACIEARKKEIDLLNESKKAIIADAVTHGLNPDAEMKDSGIPWIDIIPAHWEVIRMKGLFEESDEKSETGTEELLSLSQYTGIKRKSDCEKTGMFEAESTVGYKIVHKGQFVMNIMLAWNGSYAVSDYEGIISPAYCVFNFRRVCNKKYYDFLLRIQAYSGAFKTESRGIIDSRLRLYPYKFYSFPVLVPPIEEQNQIVDAIEKRVSNIDIVIEKMQGQIEELKEYKQRLISDVVTGQKKVK